MPMKQQEQLTVSVRDAAGLLGISRDAAYRLIRAGRIPVIRLGPQNLRISVAELNRIVSEGERVA
jgi:excisionase family DNA binding protein